MEQLQDLGGTPLRLERERRTPVLASETGVTHLFDLGQEREATHQPLASHLPQRREVGVAEPAVPAPGILLGTRSQADRTCYGDVEHIQSPRAAWNPREEASLFVADAHDPVFDEDLEADFVELAHRDDVGGKARQVVDVGELTVLAVLAGEEDRADAVNPRQGVIPEADGARDSGVEVGERGAATSHVVGGT